MNENRIAPHIPDSYLGANRPKPDGIMDPAGEAGWFLMREREDRGLSLEQAGAQTGIHPYHLEAIELGNMTNMPSRAEALEMIAAYANFLSFEPEPLLHHYVSFLPAPQVAPRRHPANPAPLSSAKVLTFGNFIKLPALNMKLPSMAAMANFPKLPPMPRMPDMPSGNGGIVASVVAAFLLFSGVTWMLVPSSDDGLSSEQVASLEPADPMPTASTGPELATVKVTETPLDAEPLAVVEAQEPLTSPAPDVGEDVLGAFIQDTVAGAKDVSASEQQVASLVEGRTYGSPDEKVRLVLKANRNIWLLIEDGKGNRVATQLMNKGDVFRVPNKPGLVATVQDGGAITYIIDGVEKGVLGQPGAVLAAESLDVKKLEDRV
jgi:cytoskeleton protein RodZ